MKLPPILQKILIALGVVLVLLIATGSADIAADIVLWIWHTGQDLWNGVKVFFRELKKG